MSNTEYDKGWEAGRQWAKANWYDSKVGKNVDGGILARHIQAAGFAEGVRWALGNPTKA